MSSLHRCKVIVGRCLMLVLHCIVAFERDLSQLTVCFVIHSVNCPTAAVVFRVFDLSILTRRPPVSCVYF